MVLLFTKIGTQLGVMIDQPNDRKIHHKPIPRTGGPAIIVGCLIPMIILFRGDEIILGLCLGAMCILLTGILDDLWNLNYKWKFAGQVVAATVTLLISGVRFHSLGDLWPGYIFDFGLLSLPLSVFFLVATINMINLSDGLDGLAGGICFLIFCAVGFLAFFQTDFRLLALIVCSIGAIVGFLRYNTYPATVFMGDTGSQFLGFMAGFLMILLTQVKTSYSPVISFYLIGVPVIDTIMVIVERMRHHRPICRADNSHIHHKLMRLGLRHQESVLVIYALQLVFILIALAGRYSSNGILLVAFLSLTVLCLFLNNLSSKKSGTFMLQNNNSSRTSVKVRRKGLLIFSKQMVSRLTWYGIIGILFVFYAVSPFLLELIPKGIGFFSLAVIICLVLLKRVNFSYVGIILGISFYFLGVYYIFFTEYSQSSFFLTSQYRLHYNILFFLLAMCYLGYLVSTLERISFTTNDFLMLTFVIFLFFLPNTYPWTLHVRAIAVKSFLIFVCLEMIFKKLKVQMDSKLSPVTLTPLILILGLNFLIAFWPFMM
jgi:UDP-GlcNAc:undecaprenyl-phosphate GlcNAc-1-phosphate transferase